MAVVPSHVRRSVLVNKHIKRIIVIFIHSIRSNSKLNSFDLIGFNSNSIRFKSNSNQDSCFQHCVYDLKYIRSLESDVLWELYINTETQSPQMLSLRLKQFLVIFSFESSISLKSVNGHSNSCFKSHKRASTLALSSFSCSV